MAPVNLGPDGHRHIQDAREYLEHNELELALDSIAEAAQDAALPDVFWVALEAAASSMGLQGRATEVRRRFNDTRSPRGGPSA